MSSPPAVLQVLPALVAGGVERGTLEIAAALARGGLRSIVASAGGPLVAALEACGAHHVTLPLDRKSPAALVANARSLAQLAREERVAILHARSRSPAWSGLWAARRAGAAFVTTYHGAYNENFPGKRTYNSVMARGDRVIAISTFIADLVRRRHGVPPSRLRVIPRGVDPRVFDPASVSAERIAAIALAWKLPPGRPVVMLPARLTRWKGGGVLLRALALLMPAPPFAVLVGEGGFRVELEREVVALGLAGHVTLPGHASDMPAALLLADLVVHASTDAEAFGRTVIEAQAMGRPVIAADLGGPRETVRDGRTGWLVRPGDADALAAAIAGVLAMPAAERRAVGSAARAAVLSDFTVAAMQESTLNVYRELL